jgi:hypothetical protein
MREKGLTKVKMKAIDPQIFFVPQKIQKVPRAYESLNPGLDFVFKIQSLTRKKTKKMLKSRLSDEFLTFPLGKNNANAKIVLGTIFMIK